MNPRSSPCLAYSEQNGGYASPVLERPSPVPGVAEKHQSWLSAANLQPFPPETSSSPSSFLLKTRDFFQQQSGLFGIQLA